MGVVFLEKFIMTFRKSDCSPVLLRYVQNKVITTMVIRPLDDLPRCAQSVVADLRPVGLGYVRAGNELICNPLMGSY